MLERRRRERTERQRALDEWTAKRRDKGIVCPRRGKDREGEQDRGAAKEAQSDVQTERIIKLDGKMRYKRDEFSKEHKQRKIK